MVVPPHKSGQGTLEQKVRRSYPDCTVVPQHHSALVTNWSATKTYHSTLPGLPGLPYTLPCIIETTVSTSPHLTSPHFTSPNTRSVWVWLCCWYCQCQCVVSVQHTSNCATDLPSTTRLGAESPANPGFLLLCRSEATERRC